MSGVRVLYVAGYSRCGSTALNMLLGAHPDAVAVGEVCFLPEEWRRPARVCGCGRPYPDCDFWGGLGETVDFTADLPLLVKQIEGRGAADPVGEDAARYGAYARVVLDHARRASGADLVVDASKSARDAARRPVALARHAGQEVHVVHLVRSARATVQSYRRNGSNWAAEGLIEPPKLLPYRAMMGWRAANREAAKLEAEFGPARFTRIRYDDLVTDPERALRPLGDKLHLDLAPILDAVAARTPLAAGHQVGGNRVRFEAKPFEPRGRPEAPPRLPLQQEAALRLLTHRV